MTLLLYPIDDIRHDSHGVATGFPGADTTFDRTGFDDGSLIEALDGQVVGNADYDPDVDLDYDGVINGDETMIAKNRILMTQRSLMI